MMAKQEESWYETSLDLERIRQIFGSVLVEADITQLQANPLHDLPPFAVLAEQMHAPFKKPKFGSGLAAAQIMVHEWGNSRGVQFIALGTSFGQQTATSFAHGNTMNRLAAMKQNPAFKSSKNMVAALVAALKSADPQLKQVQ